MSKAVTNVLAIVIVTIVVAAAIGVGLYAFYALNQRQSSNVISIGDDAGVFDASDIADVYAMTVALKQFGYTANVAVFTGPTPTADALLAGTVNIANSEPTAVVDLAAKGERVVAFGVGDPASDEIMICTKNITSIAQLATQNVTVGMTSLTDGSYYIPAVWLASHGYNPSDVNWVTIPGAASRGAALLAGKIPCGATDVASSIILLGQPNNEFHIVASLATLVAGLPFTLWYTTQSYFTSHQSAILALLKAYVVAYRWVQNKQNYMSFAPSVLGSQINTTTLSASYDTLVRIGYYVPDAPWNQTIATLIANVSTTYLSESYVSPSTWTDFSLYQQALLAEGPYTTTG